jgi:hypothetical protein
MSGVSARWLVLGSGFIPEHVLYCIDTFPLAVCRCYLLNRRSKVQHYVIRIQQHLPAGLAASQPCNSQPFAQHHVSIGSSCDNVDQRCPSPHLCLPFRRMLLQKNHSMIASKVQMPMHESNVLMLFPTIKIIEKRSRRQE